MTNLTTASNQWANRPADERFWNLQDMLDATRAYRERARTASITYRQLRCEDTAGDLAIIGPTGARATLTHYAFGQLAQDVKAPADYLRSLPATMARDCINLGLQNLPQERTAALLFDQQGAELSARCVTSDKYQRIWNSEIVERLLPLVEYGWQIPPARPSANGVDTRPATEADILRLSQSNGLAIKVGDPIAAAGLYASDRDMFAFLVNESARIEDGSEGGLARGFFVSNSEVGNASLKVTRFLYRSVCGNHIVWGAENVSEISIRHIGDAGARFGREFVAELRRYSDQSTGDDQERISKAKTCILGGTKEEILDKLFGMKRLALSRKALESAYTFAERESAENRTGSPHSAWGFAGGLTRLAQDSTYASERTKLDRAAGKVLEMAF
jgi:hypothetical protein